MLLKVYITGKLTVTRAVVSNSQVSFMYVANILLLVASEQQTEILEGCGKMWK